MNRALVGKELHQHWFALLAAGVLGLLLFAILVGTTALRGVAGSPLEGLQHFVQVVIPVLAVLLGGRLVHSEYAARTQLFLEALPLARWQLPVVKYVLGQVVISGICAAAVAVSLGLAGWQERFLDLRLAAIVSLRALSYATCAFSLLFLYGFLGRYRLALFIAAFLGVLFLEESSNLQWSKFGPFALVNATFAYERELVPWTELRITWLLTLGFTGVAFALALVREGSVASLLAQRMSHREKIFTTVLLLSFVWTFTLLSEKTKRTPFDLVNAFAATNGPVVVKVSARGEARALQDLADTLGHELRGVCDYLSRETLPPVFITQREDLDVNRYERGELEQADGVFVQANVLAPGWDTRHFLAWLIRETLIVGTNGRASFEPRRWVLDGFPDFYLAGPETLPAITNHPVLALRALHGARSGIDPVMTRHWLRFREQVGEEIASAVGWSMLTTLNRQAGAERCRRFLEVLLGHATPKDVRAMFGPSAWPAVEVLTLVTGLSEVVFFEACRKNLDAARAARLTELGQLPSLRGEVHLRPLSEASRTLEYAVEINPAPPPGTRYSFLHHALPPTDEEVDPREIRREQHLYVPGRVQELPEGWSRGTRIYFTFALYVPALQCEVVSGWVRKEVE